MKYRIKIVTYESGEKEYYPQVKKWFRWRKLDHLGDIDYTNDSNPHDSREKALRSINRHYADNPKVSAIEFDHIRK